MLQLVMLDGMLPRPMPTNPLWNSSYSRNVIIAGCQNISPALLKISRGSSVRGCGWVSQRAAPDCWPPERFGRPRTAGRWFMILA